MYSINNISFLDFGILPSIAQGEGIAMKGVFDMPKRIGDTHHAWADEDSVEPFVDADEIFFGSRELEFSGLIIGTKIEAETNLNLFKALVATFTDLVPLATPYGTFSVLVKRIISKQTAGATTITILFTEPQLGLVVIPEVETTYYSAAYSENAIKNNCQSGFSGSEVDLTSEAGAFTSILSQVAADQLAIDWVREQKQEYANVNGVCTANPTVYYNTKLTVELQKSNCGNDETGTMASYTVAAFTYSSLISQADADAKAQADADANFTQIEANNQGTCIVDTKFVKISTQLISHAFFWRKRVETFEIQGNVTVGEKYNLQVYSVEISYIAQIGDTKADVLLGLYKQINGEVPYQPVNWNSRNSAPLNNPYGYPPTAQSYTTSGRITIVLDQQHLFVSYIN